jgi:outer membrane lipoprotein SlyB
MEAQEHKRRLHPLVAGASVAVIVLSAVGVAAITGHLPGTQAEKGPEAQAVASAPAGKSLDRPLQRPAPPRQQIAAAPAPCVNCAVVVGVTEVKVKGEGTGLGAVAGGVAGALLGNELGSGGSRGSRNVATVAGGAAGALAGHEIEKYARSGKRYDVALRMEDGSSRTVSFAELPTWRAGDRVRVVDGKIEPR